MALRGHDAGDAKRRRRAQDGAYVVGVRHLIEHEQEAVGGQVFKIDQRQRARFQQYALMNCI